MLAKSLKPIVQRGLSFTLTAAKLDEFLIVNDNPRWTIGLRLLASIA